LTARGETSIKAGVKWIEDTGRGLRVRVHVVPRASRDDIKGLHGDALKVKLRAPPVEGKANKALVEFLAQVLGVPASRIAILSGETGRSKSVRITGLTEAIAREKLGISD
jgi:uncharacterized protein